MCDPKTLAPAFGVDVVRAVSKNDTRESDKYMDELFTNAGLPLVHVTSSEKYDRSEIVNLFQLAVLKIGGTGSLRVKRDTDAVPQCPVCGKMMVLRIQRDGPRSRTYYGCMDSRRCAGVVSID